MPLSLLRRLFIFYSILYLSNGQHQFYQVPPHDVSALVGSNVTIPCVVTPPHGDVQWTKDGLALGYDRQLPAFPSWSIIGDEKRGEFNFFIQSLKLEDEGIFACEVSPYSDAPALKQIANIRVLVRPEHVQISDQTRPDATTSITMRFDETLHQIHCRVDGARPAAHIKWFNETGHDFPATSRVLVQNRLLTTISTLTLVPSLSLDKKRFTCDVRHETLTDASQHPLRTSFQTRITSPPSVPVIHGYSPNVRLMNNSYLTLSCQSTGGYPLGRISWYRLEQNNQVFNVIDNSSIILYEQNTVENNVTMIVTPSDNNVTFSCQVTNEFLDAVGQTLQTNITLQVAFGPAFVEIHDKNVTLIDGTPQQFTCRTSSSNPRSTVVWKIDDHILPADVNPVEEAGDLSGRIIQTTKTIGLDKSLKEYHHRILSCQATNPETGHTVTDSMQLDIIYDAIDIQMHGLDKDHLIKSGDKISAECTLLGGNPLGKIVWFKGNELIHSEYISEPNERSITSRVEFFASSSDHNLSLTCKGQVDKFPQRFASFLLNVTFPPAEITIIDSALLSNLSMDNEDPIEFECRTSFSNPQVQLTILRQSKDGEKHYDVQYRTSSTYLNGINSIKFLLPKIDLSFHENRLTCEAILDIDILPITKQVTYILTVNHEPIFQELNTTVHVKENDTVNITLEANAYPLPINYTCFHPSGRQLTDLFINDNQFTLDNVQKTDAGVYRCLATNPIGYTETNLTVNVLYGPMITRTQGYSRSEALMPGASAILLCVIDANPVDLNTVRWLHNNQEISFDQWEKRIEGNAVSLIGKSIRRENAGQYTCEIENVFGNSRATIPLVIQYAPEIDRTDPSRSKAAVDSNRFLTAELHCFVSAIPKPTVIWMKDNRELLASSKYQSVLNEQNSSSLFSPNLLFDAALYIANVTKADHGVYQCKIENTLGIDLSEIILSGLTVPDPPSQIHVVNTSYSSIGITWLPGFDGGASQRFQIRYRLSTDTRYAYEDVPLDGHSFNLKNLRLASEYSLSMRSNNSHHLSEWTNELLVSTSQFVPSTQYHSTAFSLTTISYDVLIIIAGIGLVVLFLNIILISFFVIKRRRGNLNSENSSTTGTNETETNTVDIFQAIPSELFSTTSPTYQKYEDEDLTRPFVSSNSLTNISYQDHLATYATIKRDRFSPYDNLRLHHYYPTTIDLKPVTYRSFKDSTLTPTDIHECIRAELV